MHTAGLRKSSNKSKRLKQEQKNRRRAIPLCTSSRGRYFTIKSYCYKFASTHAKTPDHRLPLHILNLYNYYYRAVYFANVSIIIHCVPTSPADYIQYILLGTSNRNRCACSITRGYFDHCCTDSVVCCVLS